MSVVQRSFNQGQLLFRQAPRWRALLFAALFSTGLTLVSAWLSTGMVSSFPGGGGYVAPTPIDAATEARLTTYQAEYEAATKDTSEGRRCEVVASSIAKLRPSDLAAGRNVRLSPASRIRAIGAGQRCQESVRDSDGRFEALESAVSGTAGPSGQSAKEVIAAIAGLNGFDRSRGRYASEKNVLTRADTVLTAYRASAQRTDTLTAAVNALQVDQSAKAYLSAAEASRNLTAFDREHLDKSGEDAVAKAEQASQRIGESRSRIEQVARAYTASKESRDPATAEQLVTATAALSDFDVALATDDQKPEIARARARASQLVWVLLSQRSSALGKNSSETDYRAVADLYPLIQGSGSLTSEQVRLRSRAEQAVDYLKQSDVRLHNLTQAASAWKEHGREARGQVLSVQAAITTFDQSRFNDEQNEAFQTLSTAAAILLGPKLGLTDSQHGHVYIYVFSPVDTELDNKVAAVLAQQLRDARFLVTDRRDEAALIVRVSIQSVSQPELDESSGVAASFISKAGLRVSAQWVSDDTMLIPGSLVEGHGEGSFSEAKRQALTKAITAIVSEFSKREGRQ